MEIESTPVAKIGDRGVYVGSARAATTAAKHRYDEVLTLCLAEQPSTTHHHQFRDSDDVAYEDFAEGVEKAIELYRETDRLLIHCAAGISRAPSVTATVLAIEEEVSFDEALDEVKQHREKAAPRESMREAGRRFIEEYDGY